MAAPEVGNPWGFLFEGHLLYPGVFRSHYFASQVSSLLSDVSSTAKVVAEIGGGYGEFAYRLMKQNDELKYVGFDLPETLVKASFFLMNAFPKKRFLLFDELGERNLSESLIAEYDVILLPNFVLPQLASESVDIMTNTRSLSEMSADTVNEYIPHILRATRRYFLHENSNRGEGRVSSGHVEVLASEFPIAADLFFKVYSAKSCWSDGGGFEGRYVESLYERSRRC